MESFGSHRTLPISDKCQLRVNEIQIGNLKNCAFFDLGSYYIILVWYIYGCWRYLECKKTFCNVSGMTVVGSLAHTHSHIQNGVYYYSNNNSDVDNKLLPPLRSMFVLNSLTFTFFWTNFSIIHRPALLDWLLKFYVPKIILCWPAKLCHNLQLYHTFKWSWWILQFYKVPVSATYSTTPTQNTATTMLIC